MKNDKELRNTQRTPHVTNTCIPLSYRFEVIATQCLIDSMGKLTFMQASQGPTRKVLWELEM